mmetsp:Transcript_7634/g.13971  ORF Transcript_7634/g.13971 Transcript_7634/m.13971 type:complete len:126 (-) Transcript_7634:591-968(-)
MSLKLINPLDDDEEEDLLRFTESKLMDGDSDICSVEVDGANDEEDLIEADFTNSTPLSRDSSTLVSDKYGSTMSLCLALFLPSRNFHLAPPLALLFLLLVLLFLGLLLAFVLETFSLFETKDPKS